MKNFNTRKKNKTQRQITYRKKCVIVRSRNRKTKRNRKINKRTLFYGGDLTYTIIDTDGETIPKVDDIYYEDDTTYGQLRSELVKLYGITEDKITFEVSTNGKLYKKMNSLSSYSDIIPNEITHIRINFRPVDKIAEGLKTAPIEFQSKQTYSGFLNKTITVGDKTYKGTMTGNNYEGSSGFGIITFTNHPDIKFEGHWDELGEFTGNENKLTRNVNDENGNYVIIHTGTINSDFSGEGTITSENVPYVYEGSWDKDFQPIGNNNKIKNINNDAGITDTFSGVINNDHSGTGTITFSNNPGITFEGSWGKNLKPIGNTNKLIVRNQNTGITITYIGLFNADWSGEGTVTISNRPEITFEGKWDSTQLPIGNNNKMLRVYPGGEPILTFVGSFNADLSGEGIFTFSTNPDVTFEGQWDSNLLPIGNNNKLIYVNPSTGDKHVYQGLINGDYFSGTGTITINNTTIHTGSWDSNGHAIDN